MAKKVINPFENKGNKKKILTANQLFESVQTPIVELEKIVNSIYVTVNRNASFQEFQGLVSVYERNIQAICSMVENSEGKDYIWDVNEFVTECLRKFDFLYETLLDGIESDQSRKLNECAKKYATSLFKIYITMKLEYKDDFKEAYKEYNKCFNELTSTFMTVLKEIAEAAQKAQAEAKDENETEESTSTEEEKVEEENKE